MTYNVFGGTLNRAQSLSFCAFRLITTPFSHIHVAKRTATQYLTPIFAKFTGCHLKFAGDLATIYHSLIIITLEILLKKPRSTCTAFLLTKQKPE